MDAFPSLERRSFQGWRVGGAEKTGISPRRTELPPNVPVIGFTPEREVFVRELLGRVGLPLDRVSQVTHRVNKNEDASLEILGSANIESGRVNFFKKMENLPAHAEDISQVSVVVHEMAHNLTPFFEANERFYGSKEEMEFAADNVKLVARQTDSSRKFLNGYHKYIYRQAEAGTMTKEIFEEETNAIMVQLRFTNPKHLEEVLRVQNPDTADAILKQLDKTLMRLMNFESRGELNDHIQNLRNYYKRDIDE